jgi:hypothetical protein
MEKITNKTIVQLGLITGIVTLCALKVEGWGWLMSLLFLSGFDFDTIKSKTEK